MGIGWGKGAESDDMIKVYVYYGKHIIQYFIANLLNNVV